MTAFEDLYKENRVIVLPKSTKVTEEVILQLDHFLESVHPEDLRDTLIEIYHLYILYEHEGLPVHFDRMATQLYILIEFLKAIRGEIRRPEGKKEVT